MEFEYEIRLEEYVITPEGEGQLHYPYGVIHDVIPDTEWQKFAWLSFGGKQLDKLSIWKEFGDVHMFFLDFFRDPDTDDTPSVAWADPLRLKILERLASPGRSWYLSFIGWLLSPNSEEDEKALQLDLKNHLIGEYGLDYSIVRSVPNYDAPHDRVFFETPNRLLPDAFDRYWDRHIPGYWIEGYNLPAGQIDLLKSWNKRPRDAGLLREVFDQSFVAFSTFPAENKHFVFLTNKLSLEEFAQLINYQELKREVEEWS